MNKPRSVLPPEGPGHRAPLCPAAPHTGRRSTDRHTSMRGELGQRVLAAIGCANEARRPGGQEARRPGGQEAAWPRTPLKAVWGPRPEGHISASVLNTTA
ncbi:hypothetical protein EYF80_045685 [Liparis tanakae]|uniref:Uncharacterized protein n=1 Tax=Liparis tanakae TaxID=230148 RepID=A0A4Z2FSG5_9TELE|nr:hypothetical protein EYF80_045685 [Liparis tanakae]